MDEVNKNYFAENGYVVIKEAVTSSELDPLREEIKKVVDRKINALFDSGAISNKHVNLPLNTRWAEVNKEYDAKEQMWVRQMFSKAVYDLGVHPVILQAVEDLIGPEIRFNGDFHVRPKLPFHDLTTVPWHQDAFYYGGSEASNPAFHILSIWIPLVDVDEQNGCLQFVPGSHKWGMKPELNQSLRKSEKTAQDQQPHPLDRQCVSLQMKAGDMVIFDKMTFHRSLPNQSNEIRWNIDLRYSPADQSFEWSRSGAEIEIKYPSCIVRSRSNPGRVSSWAQYDEKFQQTCDRYDENGRKLT